MSIFLLRIVPIYKIFETHNIDHEHASTNDMTCMVWCEGEAREGDMS